MRPRDVNNAIRTMMAQIASGILAWPTTTIELGHATDTTLSRGAAGFMAVEGKRVPSPGSQAAGDILYRGSTEWERLAKGTALQVLRQNAALTAPEWATAREVLTGSRTYYVRTDGSNSNTGLVNNAGGAFLTIQKALDVVYGTLDLGGFNVTIQVVGGPYTVGGSQTSPQVGAGTVTILGDATTPSNVTINVTSANAIAVSGAGTKLALSGLKLTATTSGTLVNATSGGQIDLTGKMEFGAAATEAISIAGGVVNSIGISHTISGSSPIFVDSSNGKLLWFGGTTTLTGTPAFSTAFAYAQNIGFAQISGVTFSGSATGSRYSSNSNSVIQTFGSGATYLPGNAGGTTGTGGIYA